MILKTKKLDQLRAFHVSAAMYRGVHHFVNGYCMKAVCFIPKEIKLLKFFDVSLLHQSLGDKMCLLSDVAI